MGRKKATGQDDQSRPVVEKDSEDVERTAEDAVEDTAMDVDEDEGIPRSPPELDIQKEKTILDLLEMMDEYQPIIPDAVADFYLARSGFDCPDIRIKRLLALTAQKFISDVAQDAYQYCKMRQQGMSAKDKRNAAKKTVLTMEDLSAALREWGVQIQRPEYYT